MFGNLFANTPEKALDYAERKLDEALNSYAEAESLVDQEDRERQSAIDALSQVIGNHQSRRNELTGLKAAAKIRAARLNGTIAA